MRFGKVKHWRDDKGFGFIRQENGDPDIFVHASVVDRDLGRDYLTVGERVAFEVGIGPKSGRDQVIKISEAA